jgi:hypothetical protein
VLAEKHLRSFMGQKSKNFEAIDRFLGIESAIV